MEGKNFLNKKTFLISMALWRSKILWTNNILEAYTLLTPNILKLENQGDISVLLTSIISKVQAHCGSQPSIHGLLTSGIDRYLNVKEL